MHNLIGNCLQVEEGEQSQTKKKKKKQTEKDCRTTNTLLDGISHCLLACHPPLVNWHTEAAVMAIASRHTADVHAIVASKNKTKLAGVQRLCESHFGCKVEVGSYFFDCFSNAENPSAQTPNADSNTQYRTHNPKCQSQWQMHKCGSGSGHPSATQVSVSSWHGLFRFFVILF